MITTMRRRQFGTFAGGLFLASRGAFAQSGAPVRGGTLSAVITSEPVLLTSALTTALVTTIVAPKINDGLFSYDWDFKPKPSLATGMEVAPDGLTVTFTLREGVKWHDGKPFTAADVAFTAMEVWKKLHPRLRGLLAALTAVETPSATSAVFRFSKSSPSFLLDLMAYDAGLLPKHLYEGTDIANNPANLKPIGTGPFKFSEWRRGEAIILEKNADYWDAGKPYLDRIVFRIIPDGAARSAAFERGEIQLGGFYPVPLNETARLGALPTIEVESRGYESTGDLQWLELNLADPNLAKREVRQAISHALDRNFIAKNIWFGLAVPANSPVPQNQPLFHATGLAPQPFDVALANKMLDDAGLKRGSDGIRFRTPIDYGIYQDGNQQMANYLRQALRRIGIEGELRNADTASWLRRKYGEGDFGISVFNASATVDPSIGLQRFWYSGAIQKGVSFTNTSGYSNPEMDKVLVAAAAEPDQAKRKALFAEFQRIAMIDLPMIPVVELRMVTVANKRVRDHTTGPEGYRGTFADCWLAS